MLYNKKNCYKHISFLKNLTLVNFFFFFVKVTNLFEIRKNEFFGE